MVLARLSTKLINGMRVNISKSKLFSEKKTEYLPIRYITRVGIQPIRNKDEMDAILNIKAKNKKSTTN
jgi:hypothetical protein